MLWRPRVGRRGLGVEAGWQIPPVAGAGLRVLPPPQDSARPGGPAPASQVLPVGGPVTQEHRPSDEGGGRTENPQLPRPAAAHVLNRSTFR